MTSLCGWILILRCLEAASFLIVSSQDGTLRAWDIRMGARSLFLCDPYAHEGWTNSWKFTGINVKLDIKKSVVEFEEDVRAFLSGSR